MRALRTRVALLALAAPAAVAVGARPLGAQTPAHAASALADGAADRLAAGLDRRTHAAVTAMVADAEERGLPARVLLTKALQGVETGARPANVERAVRATLDRLTAARTALAPAVSDVEVAAGADALAVGVPPEVLRRLRALSPRRSTAVALGVLAQLVAAKVPVARAAEAVTRLLERGAVPSQLLALDEAVQRDVAVGVTPEVAIDMRSRILLAGLPALPAGAASPTTIDAASAPGRTGPAGGPTIAAPPQGVPTNAPPP